MDSIDWEQCIVCQQMTDDVPHCPANSNRLFWSAFHAAEIEDSHPVAICTMLPLFQDESKSPSMIKHSMNVIKQAVDHLNPGQIPVLACDQPLYATAKLVQ